MRVGKQNKGSKLVALESVILGVLYENRLVLGLGTFFPGGGPFQCRVWAFTQHLIWLTQRHITWWTRFGQMGKPILIVLAVRKALSYARHLGFPRFKWKPTAGKVGQQTGQWRVKRRQMAIWPTQPHHHYHHQHIELIIAWSTTAAVHNDHQRQVKMKACCKRPALQHVEAHTC